MRQFLAAARLPIARRRLHALDLRIMYPVKSAKRERHFASRAVRRSPDDQPETRQRMTDSRCRPIRRHGLDRVRGN